MIKGGCDDSGPTFKDSSYPRGPQGPQGEPRTTFTLVYGSLATDIGASQPAVVGIYVDFGMQNWLLQRLRSLWLNILKKEGQSDNRLTPQINPFESK